MEFTKISLDVWKFEPFSALTRAGDPSRVENSIFGRFRPEIIENRLPTWVASPCNHLHLHSEGDLSPRTLGASQAHLFCHAHGQPMLGSTLAFLVLRCLLLQHSVGFNRRTCSIRAVVQRVGPGRRRGLNERFGWKSCARWLRIVGLGLRGLL